MSILDGASAEERKAAPLFTGFFKYFPDAIVEVARLSKIGNDQHNPGQPLHWSKHKSSDHGNCVLRHQLDAGTIDTDKVRHSTKVAWRALAQLQIELEAEAAGVSVEEYLSYLKGKAEADDAAAKDYGGWVWNRDPAFLTPVEIQHLNEKYPNRRVATSDRRQVFDPKCQPGRRRSFGRRGTDTFDFHGLPQVETRDKPRKVKRKHRVSKARSRKRAK